MAHTETGIDGVLLDDALTVTLTELTRLCGANGRAIKLMVVEGMLRPQGGQPNEWRFNGDEVRRARRAVRLQRDLELNLAGAALALDLLDELEGLRERLHRLEQQLGE
jgi:chaperone modulatory protein CbpM